MINFLFQKIPLEIQIEFGFHSEIWVALFQLSTDNSDRFHGIIQLKPCIVGRESGQSHTPIGPEVERGTVLTPSGPAPASASPAGSRAARGRGAESRGSGCDPDGPTTLRTKTPRRLEIG